MAPDGNVSQFAKSSRVDTREVVYKVFRILEVEPDVVVVRTRGLLMDLTGNTCEGSTTKFRICQGQGGVE